LPRWKKERKRKKKGKSRPTIPQVKRIPDPPQWSRKRKKKKKRVSLETNFSVYIFLHAGRKGEKKGGKGEGEE